jgi:hypothetical protein
MNVEQQRENTGRLMEVENRAKSTIESSNGIKRQVDMGKNGRLAKGKRRISKDL